METVENTNTEGTVVKKTVETSVSEDGTTVITEETTIIEVNGDSHPKPELVSVLKEGEQDNNDESTKKSEEVVSSEKENVTQESDIPVAVETESEVITGSSSEEKKAMPKVTLHQFPPSKNVPNLSPFCLKLETFLRLHKIPYENQYGYKMGKNGKMPWIEYQGERKADSNLILDFLNEKFDINMDNEFSSEHQAIGRAVKIMVEENTYWTMCFNRYIDNFNEFKKFIAPASGGGIGFSVSMKMQQRKVRSSLEGQGIGRHTPEEIYKIAEQDILAISKILGDKEYILGDKPSSFDCALFGFLANILWCGLESPLATFINESAKNLIDYTKKVKELCWMDWGDMILGEKQEPTLKKGFSFRKKKAKSVKPKEKEHPAEKEEREGPVQSENVTEVKTEEHKNVEEVAEGENTETKEEEILANGDQEKSEQ